MDISHTHLVACDAKDVLCALETRERRSDLPQQQHHQETAGARRHNNATLTTLDAYRHAERASRSRTRA